MKAFTITDTANGEEEAQVAQGVIITNGGDTVGLRVGDIACTLVPVIEECAEVFEAAKVALGLRALVLRTTGLTSKDEDVKLIGSGSPRAVNSENALVHMAMCAGVGGHLWLEAAGVEEAEVEGVVRRKPRMFPGLGVDVLAIGHGPTGEPHGLFCLRPGAAFRIKRTGALEGAPPVLDVNWDGERLDVCPPGERRKNVEEARKRRRDNRVAYKHVKRAIEDKKEG